jgi:hypothetical protein
VWEGGEECVREGGEGDEGCMWEGVVCVWEGGRVRGGGGGVKGVGGEGGRGYDGG